MRLRRPGIGLPSATGLYLSTQEIVLAQVVLGPGGRRVKCTARERVDEGNLGTVLAAWKAEGKLRGRIACGIDPRRLYAVTRKLSTIESHSPPGELLSGVLGLGEDAILASGSALRLPSGPHIALTGCRREQVALLQRELAALDLLRARLVPVHMALGLRSRRLGPKPRKWRAEVRVLPGKQLSLAILFWQGASVAFRPLDLAGPDPAQAVELAVLSLLTHAKEELGLPGVDGVVLQIGPGDAELAAQGEKNHGLPQRVGRRYEVDELSCAEALARFAFSGKHADIDMFGALRPAAGMRQNLPIRTAASLLLALGAAAFALNSQASSLEDDTARLTAQAEANCKKARATLKDLKKLHEKLGAEVGIAQAFIADRIWISDIMAHVPEVVPPTMTVVDFDGKDYIHYPSKKASTSKTARRLVTLAGEVPLDAASSSPPEVAEMTKRLSESPYFHANFPRVTGANVRLLPAVKGLFARVTMTCLPAAGG